MAQEALVAIKDIGYSGSITDISSLHQALYAGPKSIPYTQLVHFVTNELRPLCDIDEQVNAINSTNDSSTFLMELSSFLKELGCPYESLTQGHLSDRLSIKKDKLLLVTYLISELMAARMCPSKKPARTMELKLKESPHAFHLRHILQAFRFSKPPGNLTIQSLFQKLTSTVDRAVKSVPAQLLSTPALNATLTVKQWEALGRVQADLHAEYTIRREMLLKRLDCTIQSFQWSDRIKGKEAEIDGVFNLKREHLSTIPDVSIADLLCAREDLAILEKTSNASVRKNTKSSVNRVIIGQVPDRGGRSWEQAPPPPEMPSWQQRSGPGFGDQRGGGRGGGGRGGYRGGGGGGGSHDGGRGNYHSQTNTFASNRNNSNTANNRDRPSGYNERNREQETSTYKNVRVESKSSLGNMSVYAAYQESLNDFKNTKISGDYSNTDKRKYTTFENDNVASTATRSYSSGHSSYSSSSTGGATNYQSRHSAGGFDSAGSFGSHPTTSDKQQQPQQQQQHGSFDSAGSYGGGGGGSRQYDDTKRQKSFDSFQTGGNMTHADQYVQESNQNQQYQRGRGGGGRYNSDRGGGYYSNSGGGRGRNNY